uniref:Uncharacterized protein n=1 Tax=Timema poppense TaxID=170557 RepID=A0A7R9CMC9_TIMPO|nr:unnamed protein product [Timema poppensis]
MYPGLESQKRGFESPQNLPIVNELTLAKFCSSSPALVMCLTASSVTMSLPSPLPPRYLSLSCHLRSRDSVSSTLSGAETPVPVTPPPSSLLARPRLHGQTPCLNCPHSSCSDACDEQTRTDQTAHLPTPPLPLSTSWSSYRPQSSPRLLGSCDQLWRGYTNYIGVLVTIVTENGWSHLCDTGRLVYPPSSILCVPPLPSPKALRVAGGVSMLSESISTLSLIPESSRCFLSLRGTDGGRVCCSSSCVSLSPTMDLMNSPATSMEVATVTLVGCWVDWQTQGRRAPDYVVESAGWRLAGTRACLPVVLVHHSAGAAWEPSMLPRDLMRRNLRTSTSVPSVLLGTLRLDLRHGDLSFTGYLNQPRVSACSEHAWNVFSNHRFVSPPSRSPGAKPRSSDAKLYRNKR